MKTFFKINAFQKQAFSKLALIIGTFWYANTVLAKDDTPIILAPLVITPDNLGDWEDTLNLPNSPLAKNILSIKQSELTRSIQRNVSETLRGRPGILVTGGTEGQPSPMEIRGVTVGQNALTFDGVPLLATVPGENWLSALPGEAIGELSVTTGSDHAFHSLQGLNGAIRLRSREAKLNNLGLQVEGGTFASLRETLSGGLSGKLGRIELIGSRSDLFDGNFHALPHAGQNERDPAHHSFGIARFDTDLTSKTALNASALYREGLYNFDLLKLGPNAIPVSEDVPRTWFASKLWLAQNTLTSQLSDNWHSNLQLGFTRNEVTSNILDYAFGFATQLMFADWKNSHRLLGSTTGDQIRLIWGSHLRRERGEKNNPGTLWSESERTIASGYAELQGQWRDAYLEAGLRIEHQSQYGTHALLHAAAHWLINDTFKLRAKAGNNFRPPDYGELINTIAGNPNLTPEQGVTVDAGFDWTPSKQLQLSMTGFYSRYNGLVNMQIRPDKGYFSYTNITHARIYGLESSIKHTLNPSLSHGIDYTYLHTEDLDTTKSIAMRPEHSARYWAEWQGESIPLSLRLTLQYRSGFYNGPSELYPLAEAVHVSLLGTYRISSTLDFYLRGENLNNDHTLDAWSYYHSGATVYGGLHFRI